MTRIILPPQMTAQQPDPNAWRYAVDPDEHLAWSREVPDMTPRVTASTVAATVAIVAATMLVGFGIGWFANKAFSNGAAAVLQVTE